MGEHPDLTSQFDTLERKGWTPSEITPGQNPNKDEHPEWISQVDILEMVNTLSEHFK